MQAVILAAGRGTRMQPVSSIAPKPMLPIAGQPLAAHVADAAVAAGADELLFVVAPGREYMQSYFGERYADTPVEYAVQSPPAGTADAVKTVADRLEGRFAVLNADTIVDLGPEGGENGGEVVATGTPEDVARNEESYTGQYLRDLLPAVELEGPRADREPAAPTADD